MLQWTGSAWEKWNRRKTIKATGAFNTKRRFIYSLQLSYVKDLLQELSAESDSSGEESGAEEEKKEEPLDEEDQAERAKLPQYASRFKVGVFFLVYRSRQRVFNCGFRLVEVNQGCGGNGLSV